MTGNELKEFARIRKENLALKARMEKAENYLRFMQGHGWIGPDADGNTVCARCTTALKRAISVVTLKKK